MRRCRQSELVMGLTFFIDARPTQASPLWAWLGQYLKARKLDPRCHGFARNLDKRYCELRCVDFSCHVKLHKEFVLLTLNIGYHVYTKNMQINSLWHS